MSKSSNTFESIGFSKYLEGTGNYRVCNDDIYQWTGTHWLALKQRNNERMSFNVEVNSILYWWQGTEQSIKASADTKREHVYQTYTRWCGSNGLRSVPVTKFWKTLQTYVPDVMHERTVLSCGKRPHVCNIALNRY